jgi:hypothetical protein
MPCNLKLVIFCDARCDFYVVYDHNLEPEDAEEQVVKLCSEQFLALTVNQRAWHKAADAQACRACQRDATCSSDFQSEPGPQRRVEA